MTTKSLIKERSDWAAAELLKCRSTSAVVAAMADHWGISRRQARRYVGAAHKVIAADLEEAGLERRELAALAVHALFEAMASGMAMGQPAVVVGCVRELRELVGLECRPDRP